MSLELDSVDVLVPWFVEMLASVDGEHAILEIDRR